MSLTSFLSRMQVSCLTGSHVCKEQSLAPNTRVHLIHDLQYHPAWKAQRRHGDRTLWWAVTCAQAGPAGQWLWVGVGEPRTLRQPQAAGGAAALARSPLWVGPPAP